MKKLLLFGLLLSMISFTASAQTRPAERVKKQRVVKNYKDGNLTKGEVVHMKRDHRRHNVAKKRAVSDGKITPIERRRLAKMRKHERRQFVRMKNNDIKRPG